MHRTASWIYEILIRDQLALMKDELLCQLKLVLKTKCSFISTTCFTQIPQMGIFVKQLSLIFPNVREIDFPAIESCFPSGEAQFPNFPPISPAFPPKFS